MAERTAILFDHVEWQRPLGRSRTRCGVTLECRDEFAEDWLLRGLTKSRQRDRAGLENQPLSTVEYLAGGVEVPRMTGRLFDQVQHDKAKIGNHPVAQARIYLAWRRVERRRTNDLVREKNLLSIRVEHFRPTRVHVDKPISASNCVPVGRGERFAVDDALEPVVLDRDGEMAQHP